MATSSTYYLNAPSLGSATAVFTDAAMTTCAPDGFYSDGVIVREMVSCVLLPQQTCPTCVEPCPVSGVMGAGQGYFILDVDTGSGTGAIEVTFDPGDGPFGIIGVYNGNIYTWVSSENFGYLASGSPAEPVYLGDFPYNCGIVPNSPHSINKFRWDGATGFTPLTGQEIVSVINSQVQLTSGVPGLCHMVIPKTSATPTDLRLIVIGLCSSISAFTINATCPTSLPVFDSSGVNGNSNGACTDAIDQNYYVHHVNGSAGTLGLYDMVFFDVNGQFPLPNGYYHAPTACPSPYTWFRVVNGVIVLFGTCSYGSNYTLQDCATGAIVVGTYVGSTIPLGTLCAVTASNCCWTVIGYTSATATVDISSSSPGVDCSDCCATFSGTNNTDIILQVDYNDCSDVPQSADINPGDTLVICAKIGSIISPGMTFTATECGCP